MKKFSFILGVAAAFLQCNSSLADHSKQGCAASLLGLIEQHNIALVQLKLKECAKHGSTDDQFKNVKELIKDKPEQIDKVSSVQYEINQQAARNSAQIESGKTSWWKWICGTVVAVAVAMRIIHEAQEIKEELNDIEREERLNKLKKQHLK
jgi:hypothetical protein